MEGKRSLLSDFSGGSRWHCLTLLGCADSAKRQRHEEPRQGGTTPRERNPRFRHCLPPPSFRSPEMSSDLSLCAAFRPPPCSLIASPSPPACLLFLLFPFAPGPPCPSRRISLLFPSCFTQMFNPFSRCSSQPPLSPTALLFVQLLVTCPPDMSLHPANSLHPHATLKDQRTHLLLDGPDLDPHIIPPLSFPPPPCGPVLVVPILPLSPWLGPAAS